MIEQSWLSLFIEQELVPRALNIDDIVATGRIESMKKPEIEESIDSALVTVDEITALTDCFAHSSEINQALERGNLRDLYKRMKEHIDAVLLYGHDVHGTGYKTIDHKGVFKSSKLYFCYIHRLVNTVLTIAYLSTGDSKYLRELDPNVSIKRSLSKISNIPLKTETQGKAPIFDNSIYVIIANLAENAYGAGARNIQLTMSSEGPQYTITDKGKGIPGDKLKLIFGSYTTKKRRGGLGLRLVKRIVEMHSGYITVESTTRGQPTFTYDTRTGDIYQLQKKQPLGTTFRLYLPQPAANR